MNPGKHFIVICEHTNEIGNTTYPMYFVNNSTKTIGTLIVALPISIENIAPDAGIDNIKDCIPKDEAIEKILDLPPKSYECIAVLLDWEIDLSNNRHILLKTEDDVEAHLFFPVPKYFIAGEPDAEDISVIHKSRWICLSKGD